MSKFLFADQENSDLTRLYIRAVKSHELCAVVFPDFKRCIEASINDKRAKVHFLQNLTT